MSGAMTCRAPVTDGGGPRRAKRSSASRPLCASFRVSPGRVDVRERVVAREGPALPPFDDALLAAERSEVTYGVAASRSSLARLLEHARPSEARDLALLYREPAERCACVVEPGEVREVTRRHPPGGGTVGGRSRRPSLPPP